ncbi:MAG: hypothetical protein CGW95_03220 [Phenylobacterium zucineum]|nr:MAG: hypothetical protein CGW95_03220 [Phenylobacterium zucineum]
MADQSTLTRDEAFNQALALHQSGDLAAAQQAYIGLLDRNPDDVDALHHIGILNLQLGDLGLAIAFFDQALLRSPAATGVLIHRGMAWNSLGRQDLALENFNTAVAIAPSDALAQYQRADLLFDLGRFEDAIEGFTQVLVLTPQNTAALHNRGVAAQQIGRLGAALADYDAVLVLSPDDLDAQVNRGAVLRQLGRFEAALSALEAAIRCSNQHAGAYSNLGNVLQDLGRFDEAVSAFDMAIRLDPQNAETLSNRGVALAALGRFDEAIDSYDRAISLNPHIPSTYSNRGTAYRAMKRTTEALTDFEIALTLDPTFAEVFSNKGNALQDLQLFEAAVESYDKVIALRPDYAEAHCNRGNALQELKQPIAALESYSAALAIDPNYEYLRGTHILGRMTLADWAGTQDEISDLKCTILEGRRVSPPFAVLALTDSAAVQKAAAQTWVSDKVPECHSLGPLKPWPRHPKLKIGYFSADFHNHATAYLMAELFECHDRDRFELIGFSMGPNKDDEMRRRTSKAFDRFIDVTALNDQAVAEMARSLEIDIAVDLKGFTKDARLGIFAEKCAPIQVNYLGYPGTIGAPYFDYIIADRTLIPTESQEFYTEKVVYLPHSYQVNDAKRQISDRVFTRAELGLPDEGFVFCCFNNGYKLFPHSFDIWMRLLQQVDGSVLWLLADLPLAKENLIREAERRGVAGERLVFAARAPLADHLARHAEADLFLDTLPCNAHTTASDALWAGLPVLTCLGQGFAGRVAGSLLSAIDMHDLITTDLADYEAKALHLATHPDELKALKAKVIAARATSPLFRADIFARHLETAFLTMDDRRRAGLPPDHIEIPA